MSRCLGAKREGDDREGNAYRGVVFVMAEVDGGKGALAYALAIRNVVPDAEPLVLLHVHLLVLGFDRTRRAAKKMRGDDARRWRGVGDG
jgi:hypothetical protein